MFKTTFCTQWTKSMELVVDHFDVSALMWFALLLVTSFTFLGGSSNSVRTIWREDTFSLSWTFSWRICWLLSNSWITFSESCWFAIWTCSTWYWSSSICFFFRIRDLRAESLLDIILLSLFSLMMLCWSTFASSEVVSVNVFGENSWSGIWVWYVVK